jgi:hypothetical protein
LEVFLKSCGRIEKMKKHIVIFGIFVLIIANFSSGCLSNDSNEITIEELIKTPDKYNHLNITVKGYIGGLEPDYYLYDNTRDYKISLDISLYNLINMSEAENLEGLDFLIKCKRLANNLKNLPDGTYVEIKGKFYKGSVSQLGVITVYDYDILKEIETLTVDEIWEDPMKHNDKTVSVKGYLECLGNIPQGYNLSIWHFTYREDVNISFIIWNENRSKYIGLMETIFFWRHYAYEWTQLALGTYVEITGEIAYNSKNSGEESIGISTLKFRILN